MTTDTIKPETVSNAAENMRSLAVDFQTVFGTTQGERVLQHLFHNILMTGTTLKRNIDPTSGRPMPLSGEDALYLQALHDAAHSVRALLNIEFRDDPKPIIRHSRFTSR